MAPIHQQSHVCTQHELVFPYPLLSVFQRVSYLEEHCTSDPVTNSDSVQLVARSMLGVAARRNAVIMFFLSSFLYQSSCLSLLYT